MIFIDFVHRSASSVGLQKNKLMKVKIVGCQLVFVLISRDKQTLSLRAVSLVQDK